MKKIIAAFDGLKYSEATKDYAIHLAKQTNTPLVGNSKGGLANRRFINYKEYWEINF